MNKQSVTGKINNGRGIFPPDIPFSMRRIIDGVEIVSIQIEYTMHSKIVYVVKRDGSKVPYDTFAPALKASKKDKAVQKRVDLLRRRGKQRIHPDYVVPDCQTNKEIDDWLLTLSQEDRRLLEMNSSNFRAYKRQYAELQESEEASQ